MGEYLLWLLVGTGLCLLVGWKIHRRRAVASRIDEQAERDAAARVEAQRQADGHAEDERLAGERAEAARIEADGQREAAERAERERTAALQAEAHAEAQRQAERRAEEDRLKAERLAAERAERERTAALEAELEAQRQAEAMRLAAKRAEAERIDIERRREAAAQAAAQAERERLAALEAQREAQARAQAQQLAEQRAEQERRAAQRAAATVPRRADKTAAQTLVLVADDSKVVRIKTGRLLAQHQYQVAYAIDGLDAVQQMQAQGVDVLITDVEMPGMDGFELTRHIRTDPQTAQLPVIMITAADDRHREQADAAGVTVLLGKPYPEEALIEHIRLAMGHDLAAPLAAAASAHAALDTVA